MAAIAPPRTDHWTDGGQSSEDFFVSSAQGTHTLESLSFPLPHGAALTGNSHNVSNQTIVTESHFGRVFGSSAVAPDDPSDPKLAKKTLPTAPSELGSAGGGSGSFTIVPGTEYGFISVANSGDTDSGFNLAGIYDVDSGGTSPDVATRLLSSSATSGFGNHLESALDPATGDWKNTFGHRSSSNGYSNSDSLTIIGTWASNDIMFNLNLSGSYTSVNSSSTGNGGDSDSVLNPATGDWNTTRWRKRCATPLFC